MNRKHHKIVEWIFLGILAFSIGFVWVYAKKTYPTFTNVITPNSVIKEDDPNFILLYNQFWQKFNTTAVISADTDHDTLVSQSEIDIYKNNFLSRFELKLDDNGIYAKDIKSVIVGPQKMMCFLKYYDSKNNPQPKAINRCH